jgi:hypothetical protein
MKTFQQWLEALTPAQQATIARLKAQKRGEIPAKTIQQAQEEEELKKYQQQIDPSGKTTGAAVGATRPVHKSGRELGKHGT